MRGLAVGLVGVGLGACTEYGYTPDEGISGTPNPPDLATPVVTDRTVQSPIALVDVLFVIDTSCSMLDEQQALNDNMPSFLQFFLDSSLDYHLGVVTTNMDRSYAEAGHLTLAGTGERYVSPETTDALAVFEELSLLGTDSHSEELGFTAARSAIVDHAGGANAGFYRPEAALSVIVLSDEDDQGCRVSTAVRPDAFVQWLDDLKGDAGRTSLSAITNTAEYCVASGTDRANDYVDVAARTGGIVFPITTPSWSDALEGLGMEAAGVRREFFLSEVPVVESIDVTVAHPDGTSVSVDLVDAPTPEVDWTDGPPDEVTYDRSRNSVRFVNELPPPLSDVRVTYEVLAAVPVEGDPDGEGDATE
jgi:hypothetical protein